MSEPNVAQDFLSAEDEFSDRSAASGAQTLEAEEPASLLGELVQARSTIHSQIERIHHLEQALDQSLASLNELRLQVVDQQLLEKQLATTEEISNIQQQAIVRLRLQLAQQQQALEAQITENQERDRTFQTLLGTMESLAEAQQKELEQLRTQLVRDRGEVQTYQNQLEQQLTELQIAFSAQQQRSTELEPESSARTLAGNLEVRFSQSQLQVEELSQNLSNRQVALDQLETELRQAHTALQEQQALIDSLLQSRVSNSIGSVAVGRDLGATRSRNDDLETQLAKQAMLQQAWQELEEERDRQEARIAELENQTADMQEQILQQAQQASEYETAVQHWKDRCSNSQHHILRLKDLLHQALADPSPEILEVLATLQAISEVSEPGSPALLTPTSSNPSSNQGAKVDLPDFLIRRRSYKARRS